MPGWVEHSYGYHGDDGQKFGANKTPGRWATWAEGDVIGCGVDTERRAIWYTRNGTLLGDAFANVTEDLLCPVVGFHSNGERVRINFGLTPFVYAGPGAEVQAPVLEAR
ncbi:ran-binding protein 9-like protein, partial [Tribonema minus]